MPARTALPPNANFGLSDWSYWSSGLIYVSGSDPTEVPLNVLMISFCNGQ